MSWRESDSGDARGDWSRFGRPGGDWHGLRPSLDNPLSWAFTIGRIARVAVRVHLFFVLFIVIMLLRSLRSSQGSDVTLPEFTMTATSMGILFLIVLLHEFGHVAACRRTGGSANEILMWPLGGLAYVQPGPRWTAHFITAAGGPAVNVVLCVCSGIALGLLTGQWLGVAIPNPLDPFGGLSLVQQTWPLKALYVLNSLSLVLLLFNLLPMFPLDGGRIVQSLLWRRMGYGRSMLIAVRTGYVGAILLGVFGLVMSFWTLLLIALFGAMTCYITQKQIQATDAFAMENDEYAHSVYSGEESLQESQQSAKDRKAAKLAHQEAQESTEVDRILQKIAQSGLESLTRSERKLLQRVTDRKRRGT